MARINFQKEDALSAEFQDMYRKYREKGGKILNLYKIMSHSPDVGLQFLRLGSAILGRKRKLPLNLRELSILRVGNLYSANYEWTQHVPLALMVGVRQSQIDAIPRWQNSSEFSEQEKIVLRYTDEVTLNVRVKDDTFSRLRSFFNEEVIVELTTAIGYYGMVCRILESLQIELEDE